MWKVLLIAAGVGAGLFFAWKRLMAPPEEDDFDDLYSPPSTTPAEA